MADAEIRKFIFDIEIGDITARPVFAPDGAILIDENVRMTPEIVQRLERWGVNSLLVRVPENTAAANASGSPAVSVATAEAGEPGLELTLGSLETEEPIEWDAIAKEVPPAPPRPQEEREQAVLEFEKTRPPVTRVMATPPPFVYDKATIQESKKIAHEVHSRTVKETRKAITAIARRDGANLDALRRMIVQLVDAGVSNRPVLSALTSLSRFDDHLLAHSVASTVYAIMTGYMMGFTQNELYELAECCLLHDIGMSRIAPSIWKKAGHLNQGEMLEIQKHTIYGADILSAAQGVSFMAELVAYQHHERFDGSGYPKGRKGPGINEYARIVSLVDVYTAMTSPRPYRDRLLGYDAMNYLLVSASTLFDPVVVKAFLRCMALYPVGSVVELSNGAIGVVVAANPVFPYRPQIKVLKDEAGRHTDDDGDIVDLLAARDLGIIQQLSEADVDREAVWKAL